MSLYMHHINEVLPHVNQYYIGYKAHQVWAPFVMHAPIEEESPQFITDKYGTRLTHISNNETFSVKDLPINKPINIITGSSVAFGHGASHDSKTISSFLSNISNEPWLNMGMRGSVLQQNLIYSLNLIPTQQKVKNIVLFAGINEINSYFLAKWYYNVLGGTHDISKFFKSLNNEYLDIDSGKIIKELPNCWTKINDHNEQSALLLNAISKALNGWASLAKGLNANLYYVLQPLYGWHNRELHEAEKKIFDVLKKSWVNDFPVGPKMWEFCFAAYHEWYRAGLATLCKTLNIPFLDTNPHFADGRANNEWLLIDRGHLTDLGNEITANVIIELLGIKK